MKTKAFAKVNLYLKVLPNKKPNKYHKIESLITLVNDFYDEIEIEQIGEKRIKLDCNKKELITEKNFVFITAAIFLKFYKIKTGVKIKLHKNIPLGSGLGGGSSDAIATLNLLAKLFNKKLKPSLIKIVCKAIGYDCYFFASGLQSAIVKGYGEKVYQANLDQPITKSQIILNPLINCETKKVYDTYDENFKIEFLTDKNSLTQACLIAYPELKKVYEKHPKAQLSGSGSSFINI